MITIIGAGKAGKALGSAFARVGWNVCFGVSNVSKYQESLASLGKKVQIGTVAQALDADSEIVILAVPYLSALEIAGAIPDWKGRILVDITTPWLPDLSGLSVGLTNSAAEMINQAARNAKLVKAFNTMGAECFEQPSIVSGKVFMPVCSDHLAAKNKIMQLGNSIGLHAVDAGELKNARATEPMVYLWLQLTFHLPSGRTFEFGLLPKKT